MNAIKDGSVFHDFADALRPILQNKTEETRDMRWGVEILVKALHRVGDDADTAPDDYAAFVPPAAPAASARYLGDALRGVALQMRADALRHRERHRKGRACELTEWAAAIEQLAKEA